MKNVMILSTYKEYRHFIYKHLTSRGLIKSMTPNKVITIDGLTYRHAGCMDHVRGLEGDYIDLQHVDDWQQITAYLKIHGGVDVTDRYRPL